VDPDANPDVLELLSFARGGDSDALGRLLAPYRAYLKLLARLELGSRFQAKVDPSDLAPLVSTQSDVFHRNGRMESKLS
jgi:hypothetical protein